MFRPSADIRRAELKEQFTAAAVAEGAPYKIDVTPPAADIENVLGASSFWDSFQDPKTAIIMTDQSLGALHQVIEEQMPGLEDYEPQNFDELLQITDQFMEIIKEHDPDMYASLKRTAKAAVADATPEEIAEAMTQLLEEYGEDFVSTDYTIEDAIDITNVIMFVEFAAADGRYFALPDNVFKGRIDSNLSDRGRSREYTVSSSEMLYVPDQDFKVEKLLSLDGLLGEYAEHIDLANAPGSSKDWSELIAYHELEHVAEDGQGPLREYRDLAGLDETAGTLLREIEADCGAFHALEDRVSPEVLDYWVAARIVSGIDEAFDSHPKGDTSANMTHETGFHLAEFHLTGEIPDFSEMQANVNGFYNTIHDKFSAASDQIASSEIDTLDNDEFCYDLPGMLAMVIEMRDRGEFTDPAQEQIAHQFITSLQDTIGIEPSANWREDLIVNPTVSTPDVSASVSQENNGIAEPNVSSLTM